MRRVSLSFWYLIYVGMIKQHFKALIDKYLSGTATSTEQRLIEEYANKLEESDSELFDEVQDERLKQSMWEQILLQVNPPVVPIVSIKWYQRKTFRSLSIAASILLVVGLSVFFFSRDSPNPPVAVRPEKTKTDSSTTLGVIRHEKNSTGKDKRILLPDGSLVVLADESELIYPEPFIDKRDINLIGKATFTVAKDKTKPFTVTSGDISTTALGTQFTVTAFKNASQITIRLYEGKVVVKALEKDNRKMKKDVYLLPGQELIYGGATVIVRKFGLFKYTRPVKTPEKEVADENPSIPENTKKPFFMFNNRPLEEVFDQLAEMYSVKIVFEKKDVKNLYFIGRYNSSTSIETILKRIATLNNLTISKHEDAFIVSK